jgi:hypothetical protein
MKNSIICNQSEVRALLDGSKTEFHLPLKPQPLDVLPMDFPGVWVTRDMREPSHGSVVFAPYKVGQIIKVRERCVIGLLPINALGGDQIKRGPRYDKSFCYGVWYDDDPDPGGWFYKRKRTQALFMPLWASRLSLLVLDVQVSKFDLWKFVVKVEVYHG